MTLASARPWARRLASASARAGGIAGARTIDRDDAKFARQAVDERIGEISHLAAEAVDEEKRRARALVEIMNALAVEIEKASLGRHGDLDAPRGIGGKPDEAADSNHEQQKSAGERRHVGPMRRSRIAG